jgi:hypothetical protein
MRLLEKVKQHRRDFQGKYKCEFCGNIDTDTDMSSYDDAYYYINVVPNQKCTKCSKSTKSEKGIVIEVKTKYPEGLQV